MTVVITKFTVPEALVAVTVAALNESLKRLVETKFVLARPFESVAGAGPDKVPEPCVIAHWIAAPATGCPEASFA